MMKYKDPAKRKAYAAAWYAVNKERLNKKSAEWAAANKERRKWTYAAWYAANKKKFAAYRAANKGKIIHQRRLRISHKCNLSLKILANALKAIK